MLFKGYRNRGFAGGREAGEPDSASLLFAKITALCASEACVPGDVAAVMSVFACARVLPLEVGWWGRNFTEHSHASGFTYVDILL